MGYGNGGIAPVYSGNVMNGGASSGPLQQAPRMPLVALEMDRQAQAIERLHALIGNVEARLSGITAPEQPTTIGSDKPQGHHVPLAGNLSEANGRLDGACFRLQSLLDRIEL